MAWRAFDAGRNLAHVADGPTVSPRLAAHSRRMAQRIYRVAERVYSAVGYALANVIFVVGDDALIVIDTTESKEGGEAAWADFRRAAPHAAGLPVRAVVYTHNHSDHIGGVRAFADEARVKAGDIWIIAHESLMEVVVNNAALVGPILSTRSAYSFGALLPVGGRGQCQCGHRPDSRTRQIDISRTDAHLQGALGCDAGGGALRIHLRAIGSRRRNHHVFA